MMFLHVVCIYLYCLLKLVLWVFTLNCKPIWWIFLSCTMSLKSSCSWFLSSRCLTHFWSAFFPCYFAASRNSAAASGISSHLFGWVTMLLGDFYLFILSTEEPDWASQSPVTASRETSNFLQVYEEILWIKGRLCRVDYKV